MLRFFFADSEASMREGDASGSGWAEPRTQHGKSVSPGSCSVAQALPSACLSPGAAAVLRRWVHRLEPGSQVDAEPRAA